MKKLLLTLFLFCIIPNPVNAAIEEYGVVGTVQVWTGNTIPEGYLKADGSAVSRTTYSELFSVVGVNYGNGDGATTFNLPNLSGKVPVALDTADSTFSSLGKTGGSKTETLDITQIPSHTHVFTGSPHSHGFTSPTIVSGNNSVTPTATFTGTAGTTSSAGAHTHVGYFHAIKAKEVSSGYAFTRRIISGDGYNGTATATASAGAHTHTYTAKGTVTLSNTTHTHTVSSDLTTSTATATGTNQATGGGTAHNNLQPYITVNYIIKYK